MSYISDISSLAAFFFGYLLGSVPFGLVLTKFAGAGDIRQIGSGNIGATNVLRTGRKDLALATLLLDAGKAGAAFFIGWTWVGERSAAAAPEFGTPARLRDSIICRRSFFC